MESSRCRDHHTSLLEMWFSRAADSRRHIHHMHGVNWLRQEGFPRSNPTRWYETKEITIQTLNTSKRRECRQTFASVLFSFVSFHLIVINCSLMHCLRFSAAPSLPSDHPYGRKLRGDGTILWGGVRSSHRRLEEEEEGV